MLLLRKPQGFCKSNLAVPLWFGEIYFIIHFKNGFLRWRTSSANSFFDVLTTLTFLRLP